MASPARKPEAPPERVPHRAATADFGWDGVELRPYKEDERALYKAITRQILFSDPNMAGELRYFEVAPGGHTTLERHDHVHAVMVIRGHGQCLVGDKAYTINEHDLVSVPPMTWHQFRAAPDAPLGFLCLVAAERDRPQLPGDHEVDEISRPLRR